MNTIKSIKASKRIWVWLTLIVIIFVLHIRHTPPLIESWNIKIANQVKANTIAQNAKELFEAYSNTIIKEWPLTFKSEKQIRDLRALKSLLDIESSGLQVPTSIPTSTYFVNAMYEGKNIGLSKSCVENSPGGFVVYANQIHQLLRGIEILESRKDIILGDYTYINDRNKQRVVFTEFCILLRTEGV